MLCLKSKTMSLNFIILISINTSIIKLSTMCNSRFINVIISFLFDKFNLTLIYFLTLCFLLVMFLIVIKINFFFSFDVKKVFQLKKFINKVYNIIRVETKIEK